MSDGDVTKLYLCFTTGVDLDGDVSFRGYFGVFFCVVSGLDSVDVEFVDVAFAADGVGVPACFIED